MVVMISNDAAARMVAGDGVAEVGVVVMTVITIVNIKQVPSNILSVLYAKLNLHPTTMPYATLLLPFTEEETEAQRG